MAIREFIETTYLFTSDELLEACGRSQTNRNLLSRAVAAGRVDHVAHGLYASCCGRFQGEAPRRFDIAARLFDDCVFGWQSALERHGRAHYVTPRLITCYGAKSETVRYRGVKFWCKRADGPVPHIRNGKGIYVTTRERTFVDCVLDTKRCAGADNCLRSIPSLEVETDECLELARELGPVAFGKVACVLSLMGREGDCPELFAQARASMRGRCGTVWDTTRDRDSLRFVSAYRVYVPGETEDWIHG